jgi:uncharacterized protein
MDAPRRAAQPQPVCANAELTLEQQTSMVGALRSLLSAVSAVSAVSAGSAADATLIETHISFVLLAGGHAYKIKKALKNEFLDYSALALRRHACEEELRLNRRLAPDLYLCVVPVSGSTHAPVMPGQGAPIDFAVKMRAFAQSGLWSRLAARGALQPAHVDALAQLLAPFHAAAAVAEPQGRLGAPAQVRAPVRESLDALDQLVADPAGRAGLQELRVWEAAAFARLAPVMAERLARGHVRECHGDLHLGNVTLVDGRTTVFDGIEFNDNLRWIDVMNEVAFMAMDLHAHGLPTLAHRFVNGYLELGGDYEGARVLRYYCVYRALVRARVALLRVAQCGQHEADEGCEADEADEAARQRSAAERYLALALRFSRPAHPVLMLTHGFSGSGKSTLTQGLLEAVGAIRVRADVERKRLAGLAALERSGPPALGGLYSDTMTAATYSQLCSLAVPVLDGGFSVILDATFLRRAARDEVRRLALERQVPCIVLDFEADAALLRERVRQRAERGGDASEANDAVLAAQMRSAEALQPDEMAAVFRCRPLAPLANGEPRADWAPLLERIGAAAAP